MTQIIQKEHPTLRKIAHPVIEADILSTKIKKVIKDMITALESQDDGVAIAAPQINEPYRIFVVSHKVFELTAGHKNKRGKHMVFINPTIIKLSKDKKNLEEGCLSVRYLYGKVARSHRAAIEATDETGNLFKISASGLLAQIFQHEVDHLNGILFIDKAKNIEEIIPENAPHVSSKKS
jgi:peptide deformylase